MTRTPWEVEGVPWKTEAAFWIWAKGTIRRGWSRHPIRNLYLKQHRERGKLGRVTKKNKTGEVWCVRCECCGELVRQSQVEVDHIHASEQERWYDDIDAFVKRMYLVTFDDLQILCKPCHEIKTLSDRLKCSFDRAKYIEKPRIAFEKKKAKEQVDTLTKLGIIPLKKKEQRVEQYIKWLEESYDV